MTSTKANRLKQELIAKYGADKVLVLYYDAYFPFKEGYRVISNFIGQLTLADIEIDGWDGYKNIERLCKEKHPIQQPLYTEESRVKYESPEEQEKRKKEDRKMATFINNYAGLFLNRDRLFGQSYIARRKR